MWFTQFNPNYGVDLIGRITPSGVMTQFPARQGFGIAAGSDGNLWFLEAGYQKTGRFNPATLQFTEFDSYQHRYTGMDMIAGPDGKLWYTQYKYLTRMNTTGINDGQWPVPGYSDYSQPKRITV